MTQIYGGYFKAALGNQTSIVPFTVTARSSAEARGFGIDAALAKFPIAEGWERHAAGVAVVTQDQLDAIK